ncbi:GNVR domain-containing protein [Dyadobacter sp. 676]|uniref:GNVR domain-containing protein n=1 Tax=Dyadobacter sp. 676 TaxID=3088362 RepID=A0AAU8FUY6_9BACT
MDTTSFKPAADCDYTFTISSNETILEHYTRALTIQASNKTASLVNISIQDVLPRKGEAILRQLIYRYQKASIEEKNKVADNTIAFIDVNLKRVSLELTKVETDIERFRRKHRFIDMAEDSRLAIQKLAGNASEEKTLTVRLKIMQKLEEHLRKRPASVIPSALFPQEGNFSALIARYNEMQLDYVKALASLSANHPEVRSLCSQIEAVRASLSDAIRHQQQELAISIAAAREYAGISETEIAHIPGYQRTFLARSREQGIQQELYLFLLKKRMETAISRSANIANARIIDAPQASAVPVYPNRRLTLLLAFLTGLAAPVVVLYIRQLLNDKITSKEDILQQCNVAVIGEISQQTRSPLFTKAGNKGLIMEQLRSLRTNIQFASGSELNTVILLTSAMANEGKSFIAAHLAQSLALACKKVLLVDFDLRNPTLAGLLNLKNEGVTESITSGGEPCIQRCGTVHSFDFLASGERCPGAGEILLSPKVGELISMLRKRYDYLLLDSPPVGLVADARWLGHHADMTLYVVRQHFTYLHQLAGIRELHSESQLPNMHVVLNGTRELHRYQYNYYQ